MSIDVPLKPEDFLETTRNISNSEVTTFLSCRRMYDFNFIDNIVPKVTSVPLDRGSVGHAAFEYYIMARLNGTDHDRAMQHAKKAFVEAIQNTPDRIEVYMFIQQVWERYMHHHQGWPEWELLGTEERLDLQLTDTLRISIRYDLKVRDRTSGKIQIGDWKFAYDFWTDTDHYLNGQMPKYIAVLRLNGVQCDGGFVEQVRTRPITSGKLLADKRNLWRRNYYNPSPAKLKQVMRQHMNAAREIEEHRAKSAEERRDFASIPVLNKFGPCKYCSYTSLCNSMNEGVKDMSVDIRVNYTQNTYGYNHGQSVPGTLTEPQDIKELL